MKQTSAKFATSDYMSDFIYNLGIRAYYTLMSLVAFFHPKAKLFVSGRENLLFKLDQELTEKPGKYLWFHAASLGEFEQGRPIIEAIRNQYKGKFRIILTFYSPSGYEVRKNYELADIVCYLPIDTPSNVQKFLGMVQPKLGVLVKYEFWGNYLMECDEQSIPLLSVSSIFRPDQIYFKPWGGYFASRLKRISHFFVQNQSSKELLSTINVSQVTVAGDSRFDRVHKIVAQSKEIPIADRFANDQPTMVLGSVWESDLKAIQPFIDSHLDRLKFIVAPHNISESDIEMIEGYFPSKSTIRFSKALTSTVAQAKVLIVDNMGMLSSLYRYGQYAYIGGAFNKGLHNILEAVTWQIPVFHGADKTNDKFDEVVEAERKGIAFPIEDGAQLTAELKVLYKNEERLEAVASAASQFLSENVGATQKVMNEITKILENK